MEPNKAVWSMDCNADGSADLYWKGQRISINPDECKAFLDLGTRAAEQFRQMAANERGSPERRRWWQFWRAAR
jgi:hypothetical protein